MYKRKILTIIGITFLCLSFTSCKKKSACEKNGHSWVEATCTMPKTCSVCNETSGYKLNHNLNKIESVNPTCTLDGYDLYKCTNCDHQEKETIAKTSHQWVNATYSKPKHCSICNLIELEPTLYKEYLSVGESTTIYFEGFDDLSMFNIEISNDSILSIDEFGKITSLNKGITNISFSLKNQESNTVSYTFEVISKMPSTFVTYDRLSVGEVTNVFFRNLDELDEESLSDFEINFEKGGILELTKESYIKAVSIGTEKVTIKSKLNEKVFDTLEISVVDENEMLIIYGKDPVNSLQAGDQFEMSASMSYKNTDLIWMTSDPSVAVVSDDGIVSIIKEGHVVINAYDPNYPKDNNRKARYSFYIEGIMDVDYVSRLIHTALKENGTEETGSNWQKYGEWYGNNGQPWCATFVSWCWNRSGLSTDILLKYQGCTAGMQWCTEQGIMHYVQTFEWGNELNDKVIVEDYKPVAGDIIFFLSSGMSHTGIAIYSDDTYLYTIEGNTSDMVAIKRWTLTDARITGYAHPNYPTFKGVPEDFSWIKEMQKDGTYLWTNVSEKQKVD